MTDADKSNSRSEIIAVIIPVYNVEKFLPKCLDSVLSQTYQNWVCVLVNDGSPDNSGKICDEYSQKDSRFKVIYKENEGVNYARRDGVNYALKLDADYISFIDPDDYVLEKYLNDMYQDLKKHNVDICYSGAIMRGENGSGLRKIAIPKEQFYTTDRNKMLIGVFTDGENSEIGNHGYPFATLAKIELFKNIDWEFSNVISGEDARMQFQLATKSKSAYYSNECNYNYIHHVNSATNVMKYLNLEEVQKFYDTLIQYRDSYDFNKDERDIINCQWIVKFHFYLAQFFATNDNFDDVCIRIKELFQKNLEAITENMILSNHKHKISATLANGDLAKYKKDASSDIIIVLIGIINGKVDEPYNSSIKGLVKRFRWYYKNINLSELPNSTKISSFVLMFLGFRAYRNFKKLFISLRDKK